jgi:mannose-6-phosphate isomerase-like protein (cupin superfamily)
VIEPYIIQYQPGEVSAGGMVVRELPISGDLSGKWPMKGGSRFTVPPGATSEPDQHRVCEMWFIASGQGELRSGDLRCDVEAGDAVMLPSNAPHQVRCSGSDALEVFSIWWEPADGG